MADSNSLQPVSIEPSGSAGSNAPDPVAADESAFILVVDDNEANRESLSRRLQRRGHRTQVAVDGVEALARISKDRYDLVLLDVMMPGMSGIEVLQQIRQTYSPSELPVIMATANHQSEDVVRALELGANDYVTKPIDFAVALARVNTQLHLRRAVLQILRLEQDLSGRNAELEQANERLHAAAAVAKRELDTAARIQVAMMPAASPATSGARFAWVFEPCDQLAGDSFDAFTVGDGLAAFYVLDVSGHGVAASLLAVAASRLLSITGEPESAASAAEPAKAVERLNRRLPWDPLIGQFLTLFYATVDVRKRQLTYTSAGHPWAVHTTSEGKASWLDNSDLPIGVGETYHQHTVALAPGDRVYLYSDGISEAMDSQRDLFGMERVQAAVRQSAGLGLAESLVQILSEVKRWRGGAKSRDDVTLVVMELE
jgi:sigma-B regulation protein RsbU (phosphoserine phosphatase)